MGATQTFVGAMVFVVGALAATPSALTPAQGQSCVGRLDAGRFAYLLPEYHVWEELFRQPQATDAPASTQAAGGAGQQLPDAVKRAVESVGSAAVKRAAAIRGQPGRSGGVSPETTAADLILDGRDEVLRSLSAADARALLEHVEARRPGAQYVFAKPGVRSVSSDGATRCRISIAGKEHPELIPETYYWEFHFRVLASISEKHRVGPSSYAPEYMSVLRAQRLPIPERDVVTVLTRASDVIAAVNAARASARDAVDVEASVASLIRSARLELLRRLPRDSWLVVQRDAANRRGGIVYDFPTTN